MDNQQKTALILMPILAIGVLAGGMFMSGKANPASAATYTDGVYEGQGEGFGGAIKVKVEVAGGKITNIELLEHSETPGIGDVGAEAVIASIIADQKTDVDVHSGATFSSNGVMEAVKNALAGGSGETETSEETEDAEAVDFSAIEFVDGVYQGAAEGFHGDIEVEVEVKDGELVRVDVLSEDETPDIGGVALEELVPAMVENQTVDIDIKAGATWSSEGLINAVKDALSK